MSKQEVRRRVRARLAAMTAAERSKAGEHIAERVWTLPEIAAARILLVYASLPEEVPIMEIAREARRRGVIVTYPRCLPATREMMLHRIDSDGDLVAGEYGLREPPESCVPVGVGEIDAALVPGLAWDRRGHRLGRGAGYYDRLFARPEWRGFRCGVYFALQEEPSVPADSWDAPLDAVVTEGEVVRFGRNRSSS